MPEHTPAPWTRRRFTRAVAAALALAAVAAGALVAVVPANAATFGTGWNYDSVSHLGAYEVNGIDGYCLTPGLSWPAGTSSDAGIATSFTSTGPEAGQNPTVLDSTTLGKINYLVTTYGQTTDNDQAAAVAMAVSSISNPTAYAAHTAGYGDGYYEPYMPAADWARVQTLVAQYRAEATAYTPAGTGSASLSLSIDQDNYQGTLTITSLSQSPVPGTITLTNGHFTNGTTSLSGTFSVGQQIPITGVPPAGQTHYQVSASATFTGQGGPGGNVHLWSTPGEQTLATPGTASQASFSASAQDSYPRSTLFAPVVTTTVTSQFVAAGVAAQDVLRFAATSFTDPVSNQVVDNPWPTASGGAVPVTAKGVWYGPSTAPFSTSTSVPTDTPIAGHATVTTGDAGPAVTYTGTSDTPAQEAGYYTWVWSIAGADQSAATDALLPPDYSFSDGFGESSESQISPATITLSTQMSAPTATIGDSVSDTLTPALVGGGWLQADGNRIPVTLTGTEYWSATKPVQAKTAPDGTRPIGTVSQTLAGPAPVSSPPIPVGYTTGYLTVQWSIQQTAQPAQYQGYFTNWSDDYGVPAETVQILGPTITTKAQPQTGPGGTVDDTVIVTGPIPTGGIDLSWDGYVQPDSATAGDCTATTLEFTSASSQTVTEDGQYASEAFPVPPGLLGSIDWIESATIHGTQTLVAQGSCGAAGETSLSAYPTVTTVAPTGLAAGDTTHDVLEVSGWVSPGTTALVRLYKQSPTASVLSCGATTQVVDALGPITVTPGAADHTDYVSPATGKLDAGHYGFVEQLLDSQNTVIAEGGCHDELFTVATPPASPPAPPVKAAPTSLAETGSNIAPLAGLVLALLLAGGGLLLWHRIRNRRTSKHEPTGHGTEI